MIDVNSFDFQYSELNSNIGDFLQQKKRGSMLEGFRYEKVIRNDEEDKPCIGMETIIFTHLKTNLGYKLFI